ncbi:Fe(3+)-hydroxamate ABC transporter permease FhuB [Methylobacterium sp. yr668]|uniref:Fe(3+)-hydroxamate ABC transporter permease FhuB n=1 Tax=Methylobacterium sp. yr668 TaxID=1761801 RepID=UPI0008E551D5|nr:Fe(3+)-hydroxamate ABC transporter permease FhuB [Methylobacterium sp. yr668]SFT27465.1 iron complex transport system permease protein [Methylobacterium sp. yr668]
MSAAGAGARRARADGAGASPLWRGAGLLALALAVSAALLHANLAAVLPPGQWWAALLHPTDGDMPQLVLRDSLLPRLAMAVLAGGGLGLAGVLFQQVLDNPLAEPGTLGVFAGAKLALALATLWWPALLIYGYEPVAGAGAALCTGLVLLLSGRSGYAPSTVILAGLVVGLSAEAANRMLVLAHFDALSDLYAWQAGALNQNNWDGVRGLVPRLALAALAAGLLARPLTLIELGDAGARGLGVSTAGTRLAALALGVAVGASVTGYLGVIGFVGLAGPAIARYGGARRLRDRLLWGPVAGAVLLVLTDQLVQRLIGRSGVPTGAVTALVGAPLLVGLILGLRTAREAPPAPGPIPVRLARPWPAIGALAILALAAVGLSLTLGRDAQGWLWSPDPGALLAWRAPRALAALGAGAMLAYAGGLLQRLTGNPLASPELFGVSAGAALVVVLVLFLAPGLGPAAMLAASAAGALATLLAVLALGRRARYASARILLVGAALTSLIGSVIALLLATADPRTAALLTWLSGSTYNATGTEAGLACLGAALVLAGTPLLARWLTILPLGAETSRAVGLQVARARLTVLSVAAILTGAATLLVGPLSFVGLMGPHLARSLGFSRAAEQLVAATLAGGLIMVLADWLGRVAAFPWQLPAGLVATVLGGAYFVWLMLRR